MIVIFYLDAVKNISFKRYSSVLLPGTILLRVLICLAHHLGLHATEAEDHEKTEAEAHVEPDDLEGEPCFKRGVLFRHVGR